MAKIFFISPSRKATPEIIKTCGEYVKKLEKHGYQVHWPLRNTNQTDPVGIQICDTNLRGILWADEIHVWYLKDSQGIHFDFGASYMLIRILGYKKKIVFVNKGEFTEDLERLAKKNEKDYLRVLEYLDKTIEVEA